MGDSNQVIVVAKMLSGLLAFKGGIDLFKDALTALAKSGKGLAILGASAEIFASLGRWAAIPVLAVATVYIYMKHPFIKNTVDAAGISATGTLLGVSIPYTIAADVARYLEQNQLVQDRYLSLAARKAFAGMA